MLKRGIRFEFEIPGGWQEEKDGNRFVFRGPRGEELIVSGTAIQGMGSKEEIDAVQRRLFEEAGAAAKEAAAHPDLVVIRPLAKDEAITQVECWTLHAQTRAGDVMFSEAVVTDGAGVMLVTFEAPNVADRLSQYVIFLKSIRPAATNL